MTASQDGTNGQRSPLQQLTGAGTEVVQRLRALPAELPGTVSRRLGQLPTQVRELPTQVRELPAQVRSQLPAQVRELPAQVRSQLPAQVRELPAQVQHTRERVTGLYGTVAGRVTSAVRRGDGAAPSSTDA